MTGTSDRYSVGNILAAVMVTLLCAGLAYYAFFGDPTGRIGRNWQAAGITGLLGALAGAWTVVKGIRSRRV